MLQQIWNEIQQKKFSFFLFKVGRFFEKGSYIDRSNDKSLYQYMQDKKQKYYKIARYLISRFQYNEHRASQEEKDFLWQEICKEANRQQDLRRKRIWTISIGVAASIFIAFISTPSIISFLEKNGGIEDIASQMLALSDSCMTAKQPLLVISPDQIIPLQNHTKVEYTTNNQVSLRTTNEVKKIEKEKDETKSYNQIIVPKGQHTRLQLADGSELYINSGSKVIYPSEFSGNRREIFVDGEIFIDVKRNESQPFYVKTSDFEVKVLGTAFNVCAYSQFSSAEVVLLRGRVQIEDKQGECLELQPDQLAEIKHKQLTGKRTVDAKSYIGWTKGLMELKGEPLGHLLSKLKHYYGVTIICDDEVKDRDIHGCLDINYTLREVLDRIAITASIRVEEKDGIYYIHDIIN